MFSSDKGGLSPVAGRNTMNVVSSHAARAGLTLAQYLVGERASPIKHEFQNGDVVAMAGGSYRHSLIAANIVRHLGNALESGPCAVHTSDMRVKAGNLYTYPDVTVVCGEPRFEDERYDTLLNPRVIIEVLSDSTEDYDRGRKFEQYRTVASLAEVLFIAQADVHVEHFERQPDGSWRLREYRAGQRLTLAALGCDLAVDDIYQKAFDAPVPT